MDKKKLRKLLVPIDFSPHSSEALRYAVTLAEALSASVWVLHVILKDALGMVVYPIDLPAETIETSPGASHDLVAQAQIALQHFVSSELNGQPAEQRVVIGWPDEEILNVTKHGKIDLIVMGTHGHRGLDYHALGSIAERVARLAPCPVLMVKADLTAA